MAFTLPDLPYAYDALEPFIDTLTMNIHHTKHHQTYVNNVNAALEKFPELKSLGIVDLNAKVGGGELPAEIATVVRNNGGGHYNHAFFWKGMCSPAATGGPGGALKPAIEAAFGSVEAMRAEFSAAAASRFGSGWAWLVVAPDGSLKVTSTPNQDNTLMQVADVRGAPVLALDVWEHAYYLLRQNRRPEYIAAWWNVVNWEQAEENYQAALAAA